MPDARHYDRIYEKTVAELCQMPESSMPDFKKTSG